MEGLKPANKLKKKNLGIYMDSLLTRKITLPINVLNKDIKQTLEKILSSKFEGKCVIEGFIKPNSIKILTYSSGLVNGGNIIFEVVFECLVCLPVEGMNINCVAKNITKAGIRGETKEEISPIVVFVARDHHFISEYFSSIKEGDDIKIKVIGQRFELNDKYISLIAELIEPREEKKKKKKPKLVLKT